MLSSSVSEVKDPHIYEVTPLGVLSKEQKTLIKEQKNLVKEQKSIEFTVETFNYKIQCHNNTLLIEALYTEDYLIWTKMLEDNLVDKDTNKQFEVKWTPESLFALFHDYYINKLPTGVKIIFPKFKTEKDSMCIEIESSFHYQLKDSKIIILDPKKIEPEERNANKFFFLKTDIRTKYQEHEKDINDLYEEIAGLHFKIGELEKSKKQESDTVAKILEDVVARISKLEKDKNQHINNDQLLLDVKKILENHNQQIKSLEDKLASNKQEKNIK